MKRALYFVLICCLATACGKKPQPKQKTEAISTQQNLAGDSAIYGLACDGSTHSILILLPYSGGDPDTFNIIRAFEERRLYGRPHIGDKLAVIVSPDSTRQVMMTVNLNTLTGQWNYLVTPTLRHESIAKNMPDSIRQRIMKPHEYGLILKNGGMAYSIGRRQQSTDAMSPVEYPRLKRYKAWHLYNGRLVLLSDSASQQEPDTATILLLRHDSLVLRFADHEQAYYRQQAHAKIETTTNNKRQDKQK